MLPKDFHFEVGDRCAVDAHGEVDPGKVDRIDVEYRDGVQYVVAVDVLFDLGYYGEYRPEDILPVP